MKLQRSTVIPCLLLIYLGVMASIGYPEYASGRTSTLEYFGIIGVTIAVIILLHFNLKRRDRLRRERMADIEQNAKNNK